MMLHQLQTPCLVLDAVRMERNVARLRARVADLGVRLRPHLKTAKSVEVARRVMDSPRGPATVSTLKEATLFAAAGVRDILYAVGIAPGKLAQVLALRAEGIDLMVVLDTVAQAEAVATASRESGAPIPALIEVDCDGHRSGVLPGDADALVAIGKALGRGALLRGVLTHA
ncbi:MAG: alanine racemase, partial [Sterolibacterium sp.]